MKHSLLITIVLLLLFLFSHFFGLIIIQHYLPSGQYLPLNIEKPQFKEETSFIQIAFIIIIATGLILLLLKFKAVKLFKAWYFISVFVTLVIAFGAFTLEYIAIIMALIFALLRLFKSNVIIHNFTEIFIYGGLAALFVPVLNILSAVLLLFIISIYDMVAVWKTKHMVSLAKFQASSGAFAGLSIPYNTSNISGKVTKKRFGKFSNAIFGGGDIGFSLMFSGAIMKYFGMIPALIVSFFAATALFVLFVFAKKGKFYPAMPFITIGCIIGLLVVKLLF